MPDWDANSPELGANLTRIFTDIARAARMREPLTAFTAKQWQREMMHELTAPDPSFVGAFRGEPGLEDIEVSMLDRFGVPAPDVRSELERFEAKLAPLVAELDASIPRGQLPDTDQLGAVLDLCAWTHAEWMRIHPFANGNGRVARLWVNALAMRYSLPPFMRLRPRPGAGYADAALAAIDGNWHPTAALLMHLFHEFVDTL